MNASSSGPCASSVLRCLAALSEAVRENNSNASVVNPGEFYDGPLLGGRGDDSDCHHDGDGVGDDKVEVRRETDHEKDQDNDDYDDEDDDASVDDMFQNNNPRYFGGGGGGSFGDDTPTSPDSSLAG